ncbi:MAG: hypothetical protein GX786_06160 [Clostridiales bacterium]|nr:hypothetical protein [Clostridiales bacterium]
MGSKSPLYDPCCGTGTILIEAAMMAARQAPGLHRSFICESWPFMDKNELQRLREEAKSRCDYSRIPPIKGSDIDQEALLLANKHAGQADLKGYVDFSHKDLFHLSLPFEKGTLIANPPYGQRLSEEQQIKKLYRRLGDIGKNYPRWSVNTLTNYSGFERIYGKKAQKKRRLYNGRLECTYYMYTPST